MGDMQFEGFGEGQPFEGFGNEEAFEGFEGTLNNEGGKLEDEKGIVNLSDTLADEGNDSEAVTAFDKVSAKKKIKGVDHIQKTDSLFQSKNNKVDASSFQEETLNRTYFDRTDEKEEQKQSKSSSSRPTNEDGNSGSRSATKKRGVRLDPIETFPTYQEGLFAPPSEPRRKGSNMKFLLALQKPGRLKNLNKDVSEDKHSLSLKVSKLEESKRSDTYSTSHTNIAKTKMSSNDEKDCPLKKRKRSLSESTELHNSAEKVEKSSKRLKIEKNRKLERKRDKIKPDLSGSVKELNCVSESVNLLNSDNELEKSSHQAVESCRHNNDKSSFRVDESEGDENIDVEIHRNEYLCGKSVPNLESNTSEEQSIKVEPMDPLTLTPGIDLSPRESQTVPPNCQGTQTVHMNDPVLLVPFDHGFRRELVYRSSGDSTDVYYFPPVGKKLRSMRDIEIYLKLNNCPLVTYNFTFFKGLISSNPKFEVARTAVPPGCSPNSRSSNASSMASSCFEETGAAPPSRTPRKKSRAKAYGKRRKRRPAASAKKLHTLKISLKKPLASSLDMCKEQETLSPYPVSLEVKEEGEHHQEKRIPTLTIRKPIGEAFWHQSENIEQVNDYSAVEGAKVKSEILDDSVQDQQTDAVEEISNYDQLVSCNSSFTKSLASNIDKSLVLDEQLTDTRVLPPSDDNQSTSISVRKSSDLYPSSPKEKRKVKVPSRFLESSPEPSSPSNVINKQPVVQQTRKIVSPVVPCTVLCLKALKGEYPQLPCSVCLCLYHKQCLGYSSDSVIDPSTLVCPSCQNLSSSQTRSNNWRKSQSGKISSSRKGSNNSGGSRTEMERKNEKELKWNIVSDSINTVAKCPDKNHAAKPQASSYASGVKATSQECSSESLQLELVPVTQNSKELKHASVQTEEEHILPNTAHPTPPVIPIMPPVLGSQTIEHIRDKQNRLRRFVVISNIPVSLERPCPFTPLPEPFELVPEPARISTVTDETLASIAQIEESVKDVELPKRAETPAWRTDLMNSLTYTYKSLLYVFSFLTIAERGQAALVCKLWHKVANDSALCRHIDTRKLKIRSLHNFFTRVRKLEIQSLDLRGIERKQRDSLYKYLNVPDAKKVVMCPCRGEVVEMLLRICNDLVEIDASDISSTVLNLSEIKNQHRLEKLVLQFSTDTEVFELSDFKKLHKMKCLSLLGVVNITNISYLEFMPRLEALSLGNLTSLIQESFHESLLRNVHHLKYLKLVEGPDWDINLSILRSFGSLRQLNVLEVLRFKIEQSIRDLFQLMPNLEKFLLMPVLTFDSMDAILGDLLDHLSSLSNLKQFCLVLPDECILFDGTVVVRRETIQRLDALRTHVKVSSDVKMQEVSLIKDEKSVSTESRVEKSSFQKPNTTTQANVDIVDPDETSKESSPVMVFSDKTISHSLRPKQSADLSGTSQAPNYTEEHSGSIILDSVANSIALDIPQGTEMDLDKEAEDSVPLSDIAKIGGGLSTEHKGDVDVQTEILAPEKNCSEVHFYEAVPVGGQFISESKGNVELNIEKIAKTLKESDQLKSSFYTNPMADQGARVLKNLDALVNLPTNLEAEFVGNIGNSVPIVQTLGVEDGIIKEEKHNLKRETQIEAVTHQIPESTPVLELNAPTDILQAVESNYVKRESVNPSILYVTENAESCSGRDSQDDLKTENGDGSNLSVEEVPVVGHEKLLINSQNEIQRSGYDNSHDGVVNEKDLSSKEYIRNSNLDIDMDLCLSNRLNLTENELELENSGSRTNVEMDLQYSDEENRSENKPTDKVKFQIGSSESSSSVPYDASRSASARESESCFPYGMFNVKSVDNSPTPESCPAVEPQSILTTFHEPQDENAHLGPPTPLLTHNENTVSSTQEQNSQYLLEPSTEAGTSTSKHDATEHNSIVTTTDSLCTVTPEDLFDYFKLALPNVQICVVKVSDEAVRTLRLDNIDWKDSSFLC